jgi:hypothetical protein
MPVTSDGVRRRPAPLRHLIKDVACDDGLSPLPSRTARVKALPDARLVPEEGVLHTGLSMIARPSSTVVVRPLSVIDRLSRPLRGAWTPLIQFPLSERQGLNESSAVNLTDLSESPFVFLRGSFYRWVQLWPTVCSAHGQQQTWSALWSMSGERGKKRRAN